jgi:hypothetical protein
LYVPRADAMANAPRQNYKRFNVRAIFEIKVVVDFLKSKKVPVKKVNTFENVNILLY